MCDTIFIKYKLKTKNRFFICIKQLFTEIKILKKTFFKIFLMHYHNYLNIKKRKNSNDK